MRSFCLITGFLGVTLMTIGTIGVLTNLSFDTIRVSTKGAFQGAFRTQEQASLDLFLQRSFSPDRLCRTGGTRGKRS